MPDVLIVEDQPDLRQLTEWVLSDEGFTVITAENGAEALELLELKPSLILLDLRMPVMGGEECFRRIRAQGIKTPVLIFSANQAELTSANLNAQGWIQKPFELDVLVETVKSFVPLQREV